MGIPLNYIYEYDFTILQIALSYSWTLPRAKNCSPALNFCTSLQTGAALSSPSRPEGEINEGIPIGYPLIYLVHRKGLEPPTLGTGIRCSIH